MVALQTPDFAPSASKEYCLGGQAFLIVVIGVGDD